MVPLGHSPRRIEVVTGINNHRFCIFLEDADHRRLISFEVSKEDYDDYGEDTCDDYGVLYDDDFDEALILSSTRFGVK